LEPQSVVLIAAKTGRFTASVITMKDDLIKPKEQFDYWLFDMDDALERFLAMFAPDVRPRLDYSEESLDVVEHWILERYSNPKALTAVSARDVLDGLARYVGETFRQQVGGHWEIRLDDPQYVYFGLPQLTGYSDKPTPICAHSLVTAATDRRTGSYLRTVLRNVKRRLQQGSHSRT
jgi:hypothetical protein